ncbi:MAG: hypothetical protein NC131_16195 [Roseburia sp.]|nr:hypothetical protein [Roseburia sp.]
MKEKNFSAVKLILTIILFIITIMVGFLMEKVQPANTKEMSATPAVVTQMAGAVPGEMPCGPPTPEVIRNKYKKKEPKLLPTPTPAPTPRPTPVPTPSVGADKTDRIASYYQGDASWKSKLTWSGNWGKKKYKGKKFGAFGCGLCCMANIYSSLSPYRCSPLDMLEYAKEVSGYKGAGAIEWWNMNTVLTKAGFQCEMGKKPKDYKEFQRIVSRSRAVVVLVSQHDKKSMWKHTTGHYVTLFLYDKATDQVFLTDSGSHERNRKWVPLKKIYHSLKTKSDRQYLAVTSYHKKNDTWRNTEFTGKCHLPSNWKTD